jgi:hypothetical protein
MTWQGVLANLRVQASLQQNGATIITKSRERAGFAAEIQATSLQNMAYAYVGPPLSRGRRKFSDIAKN